MKPLYTLLFLVFLMLLAGCGPAARPTPQVGAVYRVETVALPTSMPTPEPSPISTRVLPLEVFTPGPTGTPTPIPDEVLGLVVQVISGDTIAVVLNGDALGQVYQVKYIGIEAPPVDSPWGAVAVEVNRKLTNMKVVRLVRDQTEFDAEGQLLRYVYLGNQMLSIILTEQGLARAAVTEPNTHFRQEILDAEARAKEGRLGLWGPLPTATPGRSRPTQPAAATATSTGSAPATGTSAPTSGSTGTAGSQSSTPTPGTATPGSQ
jgi:endonuclease YncB( thermonuclease family)